MENPFRNIAIHLQAAGPAAVLIAWITAVTTLGLFGTSHLASSALDGLLVFGGAVMISLAAR